MIKKYLFLLLCAFSLSAHSADNFNTLDTNGTAAATQSGTWTVQPGNTANTTPWLVTATGNVASGATDSGNPLKIGCAYNSTQPTVTTGLRIDCQTTNHGDIRVFMAGTPSTGADAVSNTSLASVGVSGTDSNGAFRPLSVISTAYNGTSVDRIRSGVITPSATLTGFQNSLPWAVYNAAPTVRTEGQGGPLQATAYGALVTRPFSLPDNEWVYAAAASGISNTTTAVTIKAAAAAGLRNYITACQLSSDALGAGTEFVIRDGAAGTVLWRQKVGTAGIVNGIGIAFPSPLKGTAATLLEVATLTASITGSFYANCQGYIAP